MRGLEAGDGPDRRLLRERSIQESLITLGPQITESRVRQVNQCPIVALYRRANIEDGDPITADEQPISADRGNLASQFWPLYLAADDI